MNRSVISIALGLSPILVPSTTAIGSTPAKETKPNVLIIYCDQLSAWTLGCYGGTEVGTPNIDALAKSGVVVNNFYVNTPVSTPSRGCFMSGLYPTEHGAFKNDLQIRQDIPTFASELRDNGYATGYAGKWHLDGNPKRPGWDLRGKDMGWTDRTAMYSFGHFKTITENGGQYPVMTSEVTSNPEQYPTDWFTNKTIEFIGKHKDEPFCFMLSIPDPHGPYVARAPYNKMYPPKDMKMPQTLMEKPKSNYYLYNETRIQPDKSAGKGKQKSGDAELKEVDAIIKALPKAKSEYFGMIKCIDDNIGRLIKYLQDNKLYDNTIIVFSADHGDMMGEHARMAKAVPFDAAARVPFIVRYPAKIKAGITTDRVMSAIDFYPTILSLTDTRTDSKVSGSDVLKLIDGSNAKVKWNDKAFFRSYSANFPWVGVVTPKYKLVYSEKDVDSKALLIDRANDPTESYNKIDDPKFADVVKQLSADLVQYCTQHNDPHLKWLTPRLNK